MKVTTVYKLGCLQLSLDHTSAYAPPHLLAGPVIEGRSSTSRGQAAGCSRVRLVFQRCVEDSVDCNQESIFYSST